MDNQPSPPEQLSRRRPAARLAVLLTLLVPALAETLAHLRIDHHVAVVVAVVLLTVTIVVGRAWASTGAIVALALLLAAEASTHLVPRRADSVPVFRARVDGLLTAIVRETPWATTIEVDGTVDAVGLPAQREVRTRLVVARNRGQGSAVAVWPPPLGSRLVADAELRLPEAPIVPVDADERSWTRSRAIHWIGSTPQWRLDVRQRPRGWTVWPERTREHVRTRVAATYPSDVAPVVTALLSGQQQDIPREQRAVFAAAGTAHMFSVSGSHVVVVIGVVLSLVGWLPPLPRLILTAVGITGFIIVTGCELPAVRAGIAGVVVLVARYREREVDPLNLLGAAVVAMVVHEPVVLWNTGMQLSVAACSGLCILPGIVTAATRRWAVPRRLGPVIRPLAASVAASSTVALPSAITFGTVALWSPLVNLVVIPLLATAMLTAAAGLIVGDVPAVGDVLHAVTTVLVRLGCQASAMSAALEPELARPLLIAVLQLCGLWWILQALRLRHAVVRCCCVAVVIIVGARMRPTPTTTLVGRGPGIDLVVTPHAGGRIVLLRTDDRGIGVSRNRLPQVTAFLAGLPGQLVVVTAGREASIVADRLEDKRTLLRRSVDGLAVH